MCQRPPRSETRRSRSAARNILASALHGGHAYILHTKLTRRQQAGFKRLAFNLVRVPKPKSAELLNITPGL